MKDKIQQISGDYIQGDKVHGDKIGGNKIAIGDMSSNSGIAIGRGTSSTVNTGGSIVGSAAFQIGGNVSNPISNLQDLERIVDGNTTLSLDSKTSVRKSLSILQQVIDHGNSSNIRSVRQALFEISMTMPELQKPLLDFLEYSPTVSKPIKIIAYKLLT